MLETLRITARPDKRFIRSTQKGFDFLIYRLRRNANLLPALQILNRLAQRARRLHAQEADQTEPDVLRGYGLLGCTVGWTVIWQKLTSLNRLLHILTPDLNQLAPEPSGILAALLAVQPASNTARVGGTYARGAALKGGGRIAVVVFILKRTSCEKSGRPHDKKILTC